MKLETVNRRSSIPFSYIQDDDNKEELINVIPLELDQRSTTDEKDSYLEFLKQGKKDVGTLGSLEEDEGKYKNLDLLSLVMSGVGEAVTGKSYLAPTISLIEAERQNRLREAELRRLQEEKKDMFDPDSFISKQYQNLAATYLKKNPKEFEGMTANQLEKAFPTLKEIYNIRTEEKQREELSRFREKQLESQMEKASKKEKIAAQTAININEGASLMDKQIEILKLIEENPDVFGYVRGRIRALNPYDKNAQAIQSELNSFMRRYARYMEEGSVRQEGMEKYAKICPQITDDPEIAKQKIINNIRDLANKHNTQVRLLGEMGYDIEGLEFFEVPSALSETIGEPDKKKPKFFKMQKGQETMAVEKSDIEKAKKEGYSIIDELIMITNGTEAYLIDKSKLEEAKKDGFWEIK